MTPPPQPQTTWHLGTVGFAYKQWHGIFYPAGMKSESYLAHYAQLFDSVEIDSTFYGTPTLSKVQRWLQVTPENFTFSVKTPRAITHDLRLQRADMMMAEFVERMQVLDDKLGVVLIQLPPDFTTAERDSLDAFLKQLPTDAVKFAVEFRHLSWEHRETAELLKAHNVCWVAADYVIMPKKIHPTADFLYLRFLGEHGRYQTKDKLLRDPRPEFADWIKQFTYNHVPDFQHIYGYMNNDFAGYSIESVNIFKEMLGLEVKLAQIPKQGRLF